MSKFGNLEKNWKFEDFKNMETNRKFGKTWKLSKKLEIWKKFGNLKNDLGNLENNLEIWKKNF